MKIAAVRKGRRADPQKDEAILEAASVLFAERGYGVTIDEIASSAGVSKQTIYARYAGKQDLLAAVVHQRAEDLVSSLEQGAGGLPLEAALTRFGEKLIDLVFDPRRISMQRLIIAEAAQFPELAERYYESGPAYVREKLSRHIAAEARKGRLKITDSMEAASMFVGMVFGAEHTAALMGVKPLNSEAERRQRVRRAIDAFMVVYAPK